MKHVDTACFFVIPMKTKNVETGGGETGFLGVALTAGQKLSMKLGGVKLPEQITHRIRR